MDNGGFRPETPTPEMQQLLREALEEEERRLIALESRVESMRSRQQTMRVQAVPAAAAFIEAAHALPPAAPGITPPAPREVGAPVSEDEIQSARRLLAESGRQLRELEQRLGSFEAEGRGEELRAETPIPRAAELEDPATRLTPLRHTSPSSPTVLPPSVHAPEIEYREASSPHDPERYDLEAAFGGGSSLGKRILANQERIMEALEGLAGELDDRPSPDASLLQRVERTERALAQALQQATLRSARLDSLARSIDGLVEVVATAHPPVAPRPDPSQATTRKLIGLLQSGATVRPQLPQPQPKDMHQQLLTMSAEHQRIVGEHTRLLERMLRLAEDRPGS